MTTVLDGPDALVAATGRHLGHSDWLTVTAGRVADFAAATGDDAGPVVPPNLVLSLTNLFLPQIVEVRGFAMGVNYGTGAVRFPEPVPVGARVRGGAVLAAVEAIPGGVQTVMTVTVEVEGRSDPAGTSESISRWFR